MSQKLPLGNFNWVQEISEFDEDCTKNCNYDCDEGHFIEIHVQFSEDLHNLHNDSPFLAKTMKHKNVKKNLEKTCIIKKNIFYTYKTSIRSWIGTEKIP